MDTKDLSIDKKEENTGAPPQEVGQPPVATPAPNTSVPFITAGEKIHNEVTYRVIDWLVNSSIAVAFAYWSTKTKSGEKYFAKPVADFFKRILTPVLKNEKSVTEGAKWGSRFISIMAGGTAIIPFMMAAEKPAVKKSVIRWLDKKWYGKEAVENDPKFEAAYNRIEHEPKQGFWTGMAARFAVLTPMIAITVSPTNQYLIKYLYEPIAKGSKWAAKTVGIKPGKMLTEGEMVFPQGNTNLPKTFQSNWNFLHETIGFDLGLTFIYSFCHEWTYKGMAALFGAEKSKPEDESVAIADKTAPPSDDTPPPEKRFTDQHASKKADDWQTAVTNSSKEFASAPSLQ